MRIPTLQLALLLSVATLAGCAQEMGDGELKKEGPVGHLSSAIQGGVTDTNAAHNFAVGVANRFHQKTARF